jgi:hypothetical protein
LVSFSGTGTGIGKEPIYVNGKADWRYDAQKSDHLTMDFYNVVKFGENSRWGWVRGTEIIVGGAIGAATAVAFTGPAAIVTGIGNAVAIAAAAVTISDTVKEIVNSDEPVPPPARPNPPPVPEKELTPTKDKIYVAVSSKEGKILGSDGALIASGSFRGNAGTGPTRCAEVIAQRVADVTLIQPLGASYVTLCSTTPGAHRVTY